VPPLPEPAYDFTLQKKEDSIAVGRDGTRTVYTLASPSGIGGATIALTGGQLPKEIVLRFCQTQDRGFRDLEGFTLTTARLQVRGSLKQSKQMPFYLPDSEGKLEADDTRFAGHLNVTAEKRERFLELTLPANLFVGSSKVEIGWIDAYR